MVTRVSAGHLRLVRASLVGMGVVAVLSASCSPAPSITTCKARPQPLGQPTVRCSPKGVCSATLKGLPFAPRKERALRMVRPARHPFVLSVRVDRGRLRMLTGRYYQIGPIRLSRENQQVVPVRVEMKGAWLEAASALNNVRMELAAGHSLHLAPGAPAIGMTLAQTAVIPQRMRPDGWLEVIFRFTDRCGGQFRIWVRKASLRPKAKPNPVSGAWVSPRGKNVDAGYPAKAGPYSLHDAPSKYSRAIRPSWKCGLLFPVRVIGEKGKWLQLWYRPTPKASVAFIGWAPKAGVLGRSRTQSVCTCCGRIRRRRYKREYRGPTTRYQLPLFSNPSPGDPVGALYARTRLEAPPERLGGRHSQFAKVLIEGEPFFIPYHPKFFAR